MNNTGLPVSNAAYAFTVTVASDASGRLTFKETASSTDPILNGFALAAVADNQADRLAWDGTINGNWDIGGTANWKTNADYPESNGVGPVVVFDDTAAGPNTAVVLNTLVTPVSMLVSNSILTCSFSGSGGIAGAGSLVKSGAGILTLGTANTYTGGTTVNAGTLALTATNNVSMGYTINGGILKLGLASSGTSLAMGSLALGNGSPQLTFDFGNSGGMSVPAIHNGGNLALNGNVTVNVVNPPAGNVVLLAYNGRSGAGNFVAGNVPAGAGILDNTVAQELIYISDTNNVPQPIIKVYLQGGQSNADGRAPATGLPANLLSPQPDVVIYYGDNGTYTTLRPGLSSAGGSFGPQLTFGRTLADFYGQTNHVSTNVVMVAIIKYAVGGTSLYGDWAAGGDSSTSGDGPKYVAFQNALKTGLAKLAASFPNAVIELDGMIWVQGETDIDLSSGATGASPNPAVCASYGANFVRLISDVRLTCATNRPYGVNLPFFLSRISVNQTAFSNPANAAYPYYLEVRSGQACAAASLTNVFMLDTDGSQFSVGTIGAESVGTQHYDTGGQQALGTAFASTLIGALPRPQLLSLAPSTNGCRVTFAGPTGLDYFLERADSLSGPWLVLTSQIMGASGGAVYHDQSSSAAAAFYRVSYP